MESGDRRTEARIPADQLPGLLQKFRIDLGTGELMDAVTIDASSTGISFTVPIHIYKVKNYDIVLHALDRSFTIEDEIVYIKALGPEESRISVMFSSSTDLSAYNSLLDRAGK